MKSLGYRIEPVNTNEIKKIYLELTNRCNLHCKICYRNNWDFRSFDMSDELLSKILGEIQSVEGLESIVIGGIGEPTVHPRFEEVLERLKDYPIHVTTNGTNLTEERMTKMVKRVQTVTVSVDGMEDSFQKIRGEKLSLIIENLQRLQQIKKDMKSELPKLDIQFVISKDNDDDLLAVIDLTKSLNADCLIVSNLIPQTEETKNSIMYTLYPTENTKGNLNQIRYYAWKQNVNIYIPAMALKTERRCDFIEDVTTFITAYGDIVPCYRLSQNSQEFVFGRKKMVKKYRFGNLKDKGLLEIWNSDEYRKFRYTIYNNHYPSCPDCDLVEGCELPKKADEDCYGNGTSCSDCLWSRNFVICP
ncbi:tungsten cofactor oxidoreducase radical SAM maturase [Tindallia magadiensis]|uniref:Tungsten cofactor oxidoreducase radical SAM maturase n=1 Tax=Tindallia magadiensis TaxID=69895 RepID=A0A1I3DML9_9FIRM|nr:tungsten cofactor oxidoreductase radical SAM maturase [Tindallia magadiensis]SFH87977.1 tungsten cofactor oxidoreducase radical SAM maturase [Tindallia magadiensis]